MRKIATILATLSLAAAGMMFVPQVASAAACGATTYNATSGNPTTCDISLSEQILASASITFTGNTITFSPTLPNVTNNGGSIVGSFTANGGATATLTVSCGGGNAVANQINNGTRGFSWKGNFLNGVSGAGCDSSLGASAVRTTTSTLAFNDAVAFNSGGYDNPNTATQVLTYTLSVT